MSAPAPDQSQKGDTQRFHRYFHHEVDDLQDQIARLSNTTPSLGERNDAIDHCLAGISRLSNEVKDASSYLPSYDQRTYSNAIKSLSEKLQTARQSFAPRQKFAFKTVQKNASAISLNDAAEMARQQRKEQLGVETSESSSMHSSAVSTPTDPHSPAPESAIAVEEEQETDHDPFNAFQTEANIRKPSFSQSSTISITRERNAHIIIPASASHATSNGTLTDLRRCVVDLSVPTVVSSPMTTPSTTAGDLRSPVNPFAGLMLKNIKDSLLVCGQVAGPAHITNLQHCVLVVNARQFRMHECRDVNVYLWCNSNPIVEDCEDVRFAPLPTTYQSEVDSGRENCWERVEDFKWLRAEQSPNWRKLAEGERVEERVWREVVPGGVGVGLGDILKAVGLEKGK